MQRFGKDGQPFQPYVIGISGGSASGKTSVAKRILKDLNVPWVTVVHNPVNHLKGVSFDLLYVSG